MPHLEWLRLKAECDALQVVYKHRVFSCNSGCVQVRQVGADVWCARYSGLLCKETFSSLRRDVLQATHGAKAMLLRMNRSMTLVAPPVPKDDYKLNKAPGVIVVRPDQYAMWMEYAQLMAKIGVVRAIVLQTEQALAHQLLECFSEQSLDALHPLH